MQMNTFTLIKEEIYDSLSNGEITYLYDRFLLINNDEEFFSSNLPSMTSGINYISLYSHSSTAIRLSFEIMDSFEDDFIITFKNEDLDITFKYKVYNKTGKCDPDTIPDIINGEFTCKKCEYYNLQNLLQTNKNIAMNIVTKIINLYLMKKVVLVIVKILIYCYRIINVIKNVQKELV